MGRHKGSKTGAHNFLKQICQNCKNEFNVFPSRIKKKRGKFCSRKCYEISKRGKPPWNKNKQCPQLSGKNNHWWKGGMQIGNGGYILIRKPKHPFATKAGYVRRSRLVMEKHLKRFLSPKEEMHHKGIRYPLDSVENKQDDRPENLQLFDSKSKHTKFHASLRK